MNDEYFFQWSESQSGFVAQANILPFKRYSQLLGTPEYTALMFNEGRTTTTYVSRRFEKAAAEYAQKLLEPGFREKFFEEGAKVRKEFEEFRGRMLSKNLSQASNQQLAEMLEEFVERESRVMELFNLTQAEFTDVPKKAFEQGLRKSFPPQEFNAAFSTLLSLPGLDILKREELDEIGLALEGWSGKQLEEHSLNYSILYYNSYGKKTNLDFIEKKILALKKNGKEELKKKTGKMLAEARQTAEKQEKLLAQIKDGQTRRLAVLLRDLGFERLEMKNCWAGAEYRFLPLFHEISKRFEIPFNELMGVYFYQDAKKALLEGEKLGREEVKARKSAYLLKFEDGEITFLSGEAAVKKATELVPHHFVQEKILEIRGVCANPGQARGKVRVIKVVGIEELVKDMALFGKSEILVTTMTQPNMVALAEKAGAIVTNEGGITSHAAVLAREFKIPCIVGTLNATKALKTGDEVMVDAAAGTVKKIG